MQRFERHVESDPVAILEAVSQRFLGTVDAHVHPSIS